MSGVSNPEKLTNYFALFGISPRYFIDQEDVRHKFYQISRTAHPDRYHNDSTDKLIEATQNFARINEALKTLTTDSLRAEYLFELVHFEPTQGKSNLPPDLAEDYFNLQETLEDGSPEERVKAFQAFKKLIEDKSKESDRKRDEAFKAWEAAGAPLNEHAWPFFERASRELREQAYLKSMSEDLEKKCRT